MSQRINYRIASADTYQALLGMHHGGHRHDQSLESHERGVSRRAQGTKSGLIRPHLVFAIVRRVKK